MAIRSIPAIHVVDGSLSFILERNGLKFALASDTYSNKWWVEHTRGRDLSIHECFANPTIMVNKQGLEVLDARAGRRRNLHPPGTPELGKAHQKGL